MRQDELLRKYLNNECTTEEKHMLYHYLLKEDEVKYRDVLYEIWKSMPPSQSIESEASERMFARISEKLDNTNKRGHSLFLTYSRKMAASVSVLLAVSAFLYFVFLHSPQTTHATAYGTTEKITLPDGSEVHLYANSTLHYPPQWDLQREVWLEGEAFFKVNKTSGSNAGFPEKFIVHTSNLDVEVLGTEFNVKDRKGNTQVVLNSGLVKLTKIIHETQELTMQPGDIVEVGQLQKLTIKKVPEPELFSSWKDNFLYFEDKPLAEVAKELKDSHGINIKFSNETLSAKKINASTPVDNLNVLFTTIERSFDLKVSKHEQEYVISKK